MQINLKYLALSLTKTNFCEKEIIAYNHFKINTIINQKNSKQYHCILFLSLPELYYFA